MDAIILSNALDTNGQNARFVRASAKYGDAPDVLKALALGKTDPAGVVGRFQLAAEKYGTLAIRSANRAQTYFNFPSDIVWNRQTEAEVKGLVEAADLIHLNNSYAAVSRFRVQKPMLLHHHGSLFREDPAHMLDVARSRRMTQAVSTIDLTRPAPHLLHWLPTAYDIDELEAFSKKRATLKERVKPDGRIRIVSCPTKRAYKATEPLIAAVAHLQGEGLPVDLVLVEGKTWQECMATKATADVLFDQVAFGYGCNAVEAWGMGIPVIAGADEWTLAQMRKEWGGLPFYEATETTIADAIRDLVLSRDLRAEWAGRGTAHVRKYHDERPALARLAELYAMTIDHHGSRETRAVDAVRFRSKSGRAITADGMRVAFTDGVAEVTDPVAVARLRYFATKRRGMGITEVTG